MFFRSLLSFIEDSHCVLCNSALETDEYIVCKKCITERHLFDAFQLQVRENPIERRLHGTCITAASALMTYQHGEISQKLIHELKYYGNKNIAVLLGEAIAEKIACTPRYQNIDYVVPIPIHKNKEKKRGYNQSELIAAKIAAILNIPLVAKQIVRTSDNVSQANMNSEERKKTHIDFQLIDEKMFVNKKVLLIDDVFTTGTTILCCVKAFERVEGINVVVYTAASPLGR